MKFGHHQSFYLRVNWLSKAMKMVYQEPHFFYEDFGFEKIGLGRNMVKSLKYWVVATHVLAEDRDDDRKPVHRLTAFGQLLLEHDRFVRLPLTSAVLHQMLATNKLQATTLYWFFNEYPHRSGTNVELLTVLGDWVSKNHPRSVSVHSLKRDLDCLKMMYTARGKKDDDPEDVVASPLSGLNLLLDSKEHFVKRSPDLGHIDIDALYFGLLYYCKQNQVNSVTLEEIQVKPLLWGKLFHFSSQQILEALEQLHADPLYPVSFIRTNQIYSLKIETEDPYAFLRKAYVRKAAY